MKANFETGLKICGRCRIEQPVENFGLHSKAFDKLQNDCNVCKREIIAEWRRKNPEKSAAIAKTWSDKNREKVNACARRNYKKYAVQQSERKKQKKYGLSPEAMSALKISQDGKCPGCLKGLLILGNHIDHDHKTGKVRGIMCQKCNMSLGLMNDDPEILERLANYLRKAKLEV
jgi:hypothetical protein